MLVQSPLTLVWVGEGIHEYPAPFSRSLLDSFQRKLECLVALCRAFIHSNKLVFTFCNPNQLLSYQKYRMGAAILDSSCSKRRKVKFQLAGLFGVTF